MSNNLIISIFEKLVAQKQREIQDLKDNGSSKSIITSHTFKIISFRKALKKDGQKDEAEDESAAEKTANNMRKAGRKKR